ncbi:lytic murein transglycosylase [Enterovibrio coralii]|uniref:Lytic murein transglycosylase n=1 Tax=Enterovibrio coralii TaxID=294935 RepID=A0A135I6S4_9GAMM|nr:lytic murein transglycosylase [Enterovibrio coralii]
MLALGVCLISTPKPLLAKPLPEDVSKEHSILAPYQQQIEARFNAYSPLVSHILKQLKALGLPEQFVLIPMLESSFNANAISHANAAGLWQLIPATAERFGLNVTEGKDERFDEFASTEAALKYLAFLYRKFEGNQTLTLAAYNAGEGRVQRAIQRQKHTHFSSLSLPTETKTYVARFYALASLLDIDALHQHHFQPFSLFTNTPSKTTQPLVDFSSLPPLISL